VSLIISGNTGNTGGGLVWGCKRPAQTAFCAAPNKKTVFIVFLVFTVAAHPKASTPQTVYRPHVARKPLGVVFFCASRFIMGALFVKSSPIPPQKLFTLASQAALERFAQVSAAHGFALRACSVLRTAERFAHTLHRLNKFRRQTAPLVFVKNNDTLVLHRINSLKYFA